MQVEVSWLGEELQIRAQAPTLVSAQNSIAMIQTWLGSLESPVIHKVKVYGLSIDSDRNSATFSTRWM
jgi:hypothetical protein